MYKEMVAFVKCIEGLAMTLPLVMTVVEFAGVDTAKELNNFCKENSIEEIKDSDPPYYKIPINLTYDFRKIEHKITGYSLSHKLIPRSFIISLVSQYDAFLGRLLKIIFATKPEIINMSEKQMSFSELFEFKSIEHARTYIIEKEIESILRTSHSDQFKKLENIFKMPLTKDLPNYKNFIEVTERRNLFVHCGGVVSSQYLSVCSKHKYELDEACVIGTELDVIPKYFMKAFEYIFEIGVKLGQVVWRKFYEDEIETADNSLVDITYNLLCHEMYSLAKTMSVFAWRILPRNHSDQLKKIFIINNAIACRELKEMEELNMIIDEVDWSATDSKFKLAVSVLKQNWVESSGIMRSMGTTGPVRREDYINWPLFKNFRLTKEFENAYEDIFKEKFVKLQSVDSDI